jgi:hypothetical protein
MLFLLIVKFSEGSNSSQSSIEPFALITKFIGLSLDVLTATELSAYPPLRTLSKYISAGLIPMLTA